MLILDSLACDPSIRHEGLYQHFIDGDTAGPHTNPELEHVVSTIDSGLLFSGMIVAAQYFGGDVKAKADDLVAAANCVRSFQARKPNPTNAASSLLAGNPRKSSINRPRLLFAVLLGRFRRRNISRHLPRLCALNDSFRLEPSAYYRLRRMVGTHQGVEPHVWFPWSRTLHQLLRALFHGLRRHRRRQPRRVRSEQSPVRRLVERTPRNALQGVSV